MEKKRLFLCVLVAALVAVTLYQVLIAGRALVELNVETDNRTLFRIYYRQTGEPWSQERVATVPIKPERTHYTFRMSSLGGIDELRVDTSEKPAVVKIQSLVISQQGYQPVKFETDADFALLQPAAGIAEAVIDDGLTVTPADNDPQLQYLFTERPQFSLGRFDFATPALIFCLAGLVAFMVQPLFVDYRFVTVCGGGVFLIILAMAVLSSRNTHPDEGVHLAAGTYYTDHWLPPAVGEKDIIDTYSVYGFSRLHSGEIVYFVAGKFASLLAPFHFPDYLALRFFNVLLFGMLMMAGIRSYEMRVLTVPLLLSPQIWYVFSYFNSDAFAVFVMMLAAYQVVKPGSWLNRVLDPYEDSIGFLRFAGLGVIFGLLLMTKINFYFFVIFIGVYLVWAIFFRHLELTKTVLVRVLVVFVLGLVVLGAVRGVDQWVNGFEKGQKIAAAQEKFAGPMFKPSTPLDKKFAYLQMKDRGVSLRQVLDNARWGEKVFRSAFGEYGYMTVPASMDHYDLVRYSGMLVLLIAAANILLRGGFSGISLTVLTLGCAGALLAVALYHAWTVDFQAQGRYMLPIVGMASILLYESRKALASLSCSLAFVWFFGISLYSYIFFALVGISKIAIPLG